MIVFGSFLSEFRLSLPNPQADLGFVFIRYGQSLFPTTLDMDAINLKIIIIVRQIIEELVIEAGQQISIMKV